MSDDMAGTGPHAPDGGAGSGRAVPIRLVAPEELDSVLGALPPAEAAWVRANGFKGRLGSWLALADAQGGMARVLVGRGSAAERRRERLHLGAFAQAAPPGRYRLEEPLAPEEAEQAALAWRLGRYRFTRYKTAGHGPADQEGADQEGADQEGADQEGADQEGANHERANHGAAELETPDGVDRERLERIVEGVRLARDLINTPANDLGPEALERAARGLAERHGAEVAVTAGEALIEANLPLIHAVGRAAAEAPRLIDLRWGDEGHPRVTLVGKGVCFDTGGLNLKPGASMELMKKDMGGAATVMGLAHMVMGLGLPVRLRLLMPAVENAVSARSFRPGDILRSRKGLTVEVGNTDAEGRLVLADALALAAEEAPALIIDMATLTGAARVALGPDLPPFFTDDEALAGDLAAASARVADPLWRLPLWPAYEGDIEPEIADLDNAPKGGFAGAITAALFLKRFAGTGPWAHFDIYAWTPKARPGRPKGGECQAARAVLALLEARYRKTPGGKP